MEICGHCFKQVEKDPETGIFFHVDTGSVRCLPTFYSYAHPIGT